MAMIGRAIGVVHVRAPEIEIDEVQDQFMAARPPISDDRSQRGGAHRAVRMEAVAGLHHPELDGMLLEDRMTWSDLSPAQRRLAATFVGGLTAVESVAMESWLRTLLRIRTSGEPRRSQLRQSIIATCHFHILWPLLRRLHATLLRLGWTDRSWSARLGVSAALAAATVFRGQSAGIAALGTAIGVPLWVVFGAGASFAGLLLDEIVRHREGSPSTPEAPAAHSATGHAAGGAGAGTQQISDARPQQEHLLSPANGRTSHAASHDEAA